MFKPKKIVGVYGGSYDPVTKGHLDILHKSLKTFDHVHMAIGHNAKKSNRHFTIEESIEMMHCSIKEYFPDHPDIFDYVSLDVFVGKSMVSFCHEVGATHIIRGMRAANDFDHEFSIAGGIEHIDPNLPIVQFMAKNEFIHVSSSMAREFTSLNHDVNWLVTPFVAKKLIGKFGNVGAE